MLFQVNNAFGFENPEKGTCFYKKDRFPELCQSCVNGSDICHKGVRYRLQVEPLALLDYDLPQSFPSIRLSPKYLILPWENFSTVAISFDTFDRHCSTIIKRDFRETKNLKSAASIPEGIRVVFIFSGSDEKMREVALQPYRMFDYFVPGEDDVLGIPSMCVYSGGFGHYKDVRKQILIHYLNRAFEFARLFGAKYYLMAPVEGIEEDELAFCIETLALIGFKWVYYWVPNNEPIETFEFIRRKTAAEGLKLLLFRKTYRPALKKLANAFTSQDIYRRASSFPVHGVQTKLFGGDLLWEKKEKHTIEALAH